MAKQHRQHKAGTNYEAEFDALDEEIREAANQLTGVPRQQWVENFERWIDRRILLETFEGQLKNGNPHKLGNTYSRIKQVEKDIARCEEISNTILRRRATNHVQGAKDIADSITNNGPIIRPGQADYSTLVRKRVPKPSKRFN